LGVTGLGLAYLSLEKPLPDHSHEVNALRVASASPPWRVISRVQMKRPPSTSDLTTTCLPPCVYVPPSEVKPRRVRADLMIGSASSK
jgi:hypothetical protein